MKLSEEIENIYFVDGCIDKGVLYAAGLESNILIEYQIENQQLKSLTYLDGFAMPQSSKIMAIYLYERSLFCFSVNSYEVMEYDLDTKVVHYHHPQNVSWQYNMIHAACRMKDQVWLFQDTLNPSIMVFEMRERKYSFYHISIDGWTDMNAVKQISLETYACIGTEIWCCIPGTSDLLLVDTETKSAQIIKTGLKISFYTLSYEDDFLYLLSCDGLSVATFHIGTYKITVCQTGYFQSGVTFPFRQVLKTGQYLLLLPCYEEEIFCYKMCGEQLCLVQKFHFPNEFRRVHGPEQRSLFCGWKKWNNGLYLFPFAGNGMLRIDMSTYMITYYPIKISSMDYLAMKAHKRELLIESIVSLDDYVRYICFDTSVKNSKVKSGVIGKGIWNVIDNR